MPGPAEVTVGPGELPPELQDLAINEAGMLYDTRTGKAINEFGATRFDVAVRALRGELDPPAGVENTEQNHGLLLSSLFQFPAKYCFQVVGKMEAGADAAAREGFAADVAATVARVCQVPQEEMGREGAVKATERMGGKYVSVSVEVMVRAPELVGLTYDELGKDARVKMKF